MVILQALLAALSRSAGRLLNTAFGWATIMLFGKVRQDRQLYLSAIALGSVVWLVALISVAFPSVGTFLLAFVTLPDWVDRTWIRLAMLTAVILLPALVGWLSTRLVPAGERQRRGISTWGAVVRGYPYTLGLAMTLVLMIVVAPILKLRNVIRRWTAEHVPVIIEPDAYEDVVDDVEEALNATGVKTRRRPVTWLLRLPTKLLAVFAGRAVGRVAAERLTRLVSDRIEVLLHPSDIVISGRATDAARVRAILAEHLTYTRAYLTWDKEANEIEDERREIWGPLLAGRTAGLAERLSDLEDRLRDLQVPYEEWEVLFRQILLAERTLVAGDRGAFVRAELRSTLLTALATAAPALEQAARLAREIRRDRSASRNKARAPAFPVSVDNFRTALRGLREGIRRRRARGRVLAFFRRAA
ncbi:MAG: hypothetical protein ACREJ9_00680 [Candidatus Rokuibacteriota bacterium]